VDDEDDIRDVVRISLMDMGFEVLEAENGQAALDIFLQSQPPIVLTDIKMPMMDGITLLKAIKHANPETEVIMITGHGDMDLAIESLKHAAADFITKPINVDILEISLAKVKDKIRTLRQLQAYTNSLEALIQEKTELKDHLTNLGLMIGSIAHGIKGELTGLDGGIYLVDSGFSKRDDHRISQGWKTVKNAVGRIRKRILDILYYAKDRDLNLEPVDAAVLAAEIADIIQHGADEHGITLKREFDPSAGVGTLDVGAVQSALVNILENAVDACQAHGPQSPPEITFGISGNDDEIHFTISDNGVGMDRKTRDQLFTLFFSSKGNQGTGMGLFITHQIITRHGGQISVDSTPGQGSRFSVSLPRASQYK
jgi:signal transduction histidine kinase